MNKNYSISLKSMFKERSIFLILFFLYLTFNSCGPQKKECTIKVQNKSVQVRKGSESLGNNYGNVDYVTFTLNNDSVLTMMSQNLSTRTFRNGDSILLVKNIKEASSAQAKRKPWCAYYLYDEKNKSLGLFYNGYAILDKRGLAPTGWHVASPNDWSYIRKMANVDSENPSIHLFYNPKTFTDAKMLDKLSDECPDLSYNNQRPIKEFNLSGLNCTAYGSMSVSNDYWKGGDSKQGFKDFGKSSSYWTNNLRDVGINSTSASLLTMYINSNSAELFPSQICCYQHMVRCVKDVH